MEKQKELTKKQEDLVLEDGRKQFCECGNRFKTEEEEELGFCGDCR